ELVDFVQLQLEKYKILEVKAEQQVELLRERRTALISAAVTGKIDVCNWQHPNQKNNNNTELSA
ncbi:MAG: restriction endonuclease subunit S, partial [Acinetobacter sp.]